MIWYFIFNFIDGIASGIFSLLNIPKIETLPLGMDEALVTAFGYFREFMTLYPPIAIIFTAFMWYMGFKVTLLVLKNIPFFKIHVG